MTIAEVFAALDAMIGNWTDTEIPAKGFANAEAIFLVNVRLAICKHHGRLDGKAQLSFNQVGELVRTIPEDSSAGPEAQALILQFQQQFPQLCQASQAATA